MFDFDKLKKMGRTIVHCPDREVAIDFVREYRRHFPSKYFRGNPGDDEYWSKNRENTCYIPNLTVNDSIKVVNYLGYVGRETPYAVIHIGDIMIQEDLGCFSLSSVDIKSLFGME